MTLYNTATSVLYRMDPERAHSLGLFFMRFLASREIEDPKLKIRTAFGEIRNPIGLAAGYDKTGSHLSTLEKLGFGYLVAGTITEEPWPGHPKPRIVRNISEKTLVNCLGFPNPGVDGFLKNLNRQKLKIPVIASISGRTEESVLKCYEKIQPFVSAVELNLSSPNTSDLRDLREANLFTPLTKKMSSAKTKPTYLKVSPFSDEAQSRRNIEMIKEWSSMGFEGVTASNSLSIKEPRLSIGTGGYSGPPLFKYTRVAIKEIRNVVPTNFEINTVGGISRAEDVGEVLGSGATTVQLMTALVYEGPDLIKKMLNGLLNESFPRDAKIPVNA